MFDGVHKAEKLLAGEVADLEAGRLTGEDAASLLKVFTRIERLAVAGRTKLAGRIEQSNVWRGGGHKTAASFLAHHSGESLGHAWSLLETAERLEALPATASAFNAGKLSMTQTREILSAVTANPAAEPRLLDDAARQPLNVFKAACRAARNAAADEEEDQARYRRLHESRYWRHWVERSGAVCGTYRLAPDVGAAMHAEIQRTANTVFEHARRHGRREAPEAYAADALAQLVLAGPSSADHQPNPNSDPGGNCQHGGSGGPRAVVHVRVDHSVLTRGWVEDGETCHIEGVGPIPAATAAQLATDCWLKVLVTNGIDIQTVAHAGRTIPSRLRTALEERDPQCTVPGCTTRHGLQIHHYPDYKHGTPASLATCTRVCRWHHYLITYCGFKLEGTTGAWTWITPTDQTAHPPP